jgi:DNA-binding NtrC family response regulator
MTMGGVNILIVDDDRFIQATASAALEGMGYRLFLADDVQGAVAVLREEPVDVIVTDHVLPGATGLSLLSTMREHLPEPRRILMTGQVDVGLALAAVNQAQVFRILLKPLDASTLRLAVLAAVDDLERDRETREIAELVKASQRVATRDPAPRSRGVHAA